MPGPATVLASPRQQQRSTRSSPPRRPSPPCSRPPSPSAPLSRTPHGHRRARHGRRQHGHRRARAPLVPGERRGPPEGHPLQHRAQGALWCGTRAAGQHHLARPWSCLVCVSSACKGKNSEKLDRKFLSPFILLTHHCSGYA